MIGCRSWFLDATCERCSASSRLGWSSYPSPYWQCAIESRVDPYWCWCPCIQHYCSVSYYGDDDDDDCISFNSCVAYRLINVISVKYNPTDYSRKDNSVTKALMGLVPFVFMTLVSYAWLRLWPSLVYEHLALFILLIGLLFGHQVGLMITAHVAKLPFPYWNGPAYTLLAAGCALAYADVATGG